MTTNLSILGGSGDIKITWDTADPASVARAREEVAKLKLAGYAFFLVDNTPADEIAAGNGELSARIATTEELIPIAPDDPGRTVEPETHKKRGRKAREAIAVPPMRGG